LIQADFILQASRQDVVDSPRNKAILDGVAEAFPNAVLHFCSSDSPLKYQWMKFLPTASALDTFWRELPPKIIGLLEDEKILYFFSPSSPRLPKVLRTLPPTCLDKHGLPLFADRAGTNEKYLSLQYDSSDVRMLEKAFDLKAPTSRRWMQFIIFLLVP
jgi:hypothetical protein